MQQEKPITGGRVKFTDQINKSNASDLHPYDFDAALQALRNQAKNTVDYADPTGQSYVAPKLKAYKPSHSFIQNAIANKGKTSLNAKSAPVYDPRRAQLI